MHIESLQVFCDVARHRSFSQGAQLHGITQSAASQIVLQMEKHLGVQLINRSTRPLQLTSLGQRYYEACRELVEQYLELEASIRSAGAQVEASVEVAAIYSVGLGDMGKHIERFIRDYPNARIHVDYVHPDRVYEKVTDGTADFGLVSCPRHSRKWEILPWRDELMVLVCSPSHRLARLKKVRPQDLEGETFITYERNLSIRRHIDRFLRQQKVTVAIACEFDNIESIKKAVEESAGVALVPDTTVRREVQSGTLVAVPFSGDVLVRPLAIIHRRHHKLSSTAQRFLNLLRQAEPPPPLFGNGQERPAGAGTSREGEPPG
jgi:DNA-binding transcriptional LysR family regulator